MKTIDKTCPKCGYTDTNLTFYEIGKTFYRDYNPQLEKYGEFIPLTDYPSSKKLKLKKECIYLHCRTCQYSWVTDTIEDDKNAFGLTEDDVKKLQEELNNVEIPTGGFRPLDCEALKLYSKK